MITSWGTTVDNADKGSLKVIQTSDKKITTYDHTINTIL